MDGDHIGDPNTPMRWGPNTSLYMITQICITTLPTYIHNIIRYQKNLIKANLIMLQASIEYKFFKNT